MLQRHIKTPYSSIQNKYITSVLLFRMCLSLLCLQCLCFYIHKGDGSEQTCLSTTIIFITNDNRDLLNFHLFMKCNILLVVSIQVIKALETRQQ